ncbi:MAG: nucleotidyltransferase family protein [Gemmatimonadaceae bacterium]
MPISLEELRAKRGPIVQAAEEHRARNVRVFGSVARGALEPWSDVDLLIDVLPGHSLLDRAGLTLALQELLGTPVDVVTEKQLREAIRDRALREAVAL